jgi:hypothetical protein
MNVRYIALSLFLIAPALASAEDAKDAVRDACKADVKASCGVVFTRSQVINCLIEKASTLSPGCTTAVKAASCNAKAPANLKAAFPCAQ